MTKQSFYKLYSQTVMFPLSFVACEDQAFCKRKEKIKYL